MESVMQTAEDAFKEWCVDRGYINPNDIDRDLS